MDSKETKTARIAASKSEEPLASSKIEDHPVQTAAEHHAEVVQHLNNGDHESAVAALMVDHSTGRQLSYGESRMMYG
tara:strand:- start:9715 stop:9945 length:231 start_codon:yes stop_codon:yes gene_type:complete